MRKQTRFVELCHPTPSSNVKRPLLSPGEYATQYFSRTTAATRHSPTLGRAAIEPGVEDKRSASDYNGKINSLFQMVGEWLVQNKKLLETLAVLLKHQNPPVTDLRSASQGFQDFGQFVAAVDVSHKLRIPFDQVKTQMLATSRLGKIAHILDPDADR